VGVCVAGAVGATGATGVAGGVGGVSARVPEVVALPEVVFVERHQYKPDHHNTATFFPAAKTEYNDGRFTPGGALKILNPATGEVRPLLETATGVVRDPEVHWDAQKIVFSYRRDVADSYHIYEINTDGTGLRQLTFAAGADDLHPFYLADDHIAFSSTREPKYCGCNRHIMANLYRMEPDGANIHQISKNTLFDAHGSLLPDGRILYDRWEYVDRNYGDAQGLWTCNPDGTNHAVYWGANTPSPGAIIDARHIPGTDKTVCIFSSCHDRPWGALAIIDRKLGIDGNKPVWRVWPDVRKFIWEPEHSRNWRFGIDSMKSAVARKICNPFPLSPTRILYARQITPKSERTALYLGVVDSKEIFLYEDPKKKFGCFDPVPVIKRKRPPVLATKRNYTDTTGTFYVLDVYNGTHLKNIKRGDVKFLRVVESLEKRFWASPKIMWLSTSSTVNWDEFMTKRTLGVVPVNADGSASFEVPAEKFVYFQLLDKDGVMLQSMRSGTMVQPGEQNGCVGCHDDRLAAVPANPAKLAKILQKRPDKLRDLETYFSATSTATSTATSATTPTATPTATATSFVTTAPAGFSYLAEVQPVWEKYCVNCHHDDAGSAGTTAGKKLVLTGGTGQTFNRSYAELWAKHYIKPVGGGPARFLEAKTFGARAGKLFSVLTKKHGGVHLEKDDPKAFRKVCEWLDLNAPYYPDVATSFPDNPYGRSPLTFEETRAIEKLSKTRLLNLARVRSADDATGNSFYVDEPAKLTPRDAALLWIVSALDFDNPERSPILETMRKNFPDFASGTGAASIAPRASIAPTASTAPAAYTAARDAVLKIIHTGSDRLRRAGNNGIAGFQYCPTDLWRERNYQRTRAREAANRAAIATGKKVYDEK
jgi:hypothetical protein